MVTYVLTLEQLTVDKTATRWRPHADISEAKEQYRGYYCRKGRYYYRKRGVVTRSGGKNLILCKAVTAAILDPGMDRPSLRHYPLQPPAPVGVMESSTPFFVPLQKVKEPGRN
ncbi:unnamed protein product [Nezara viridula]|uniref:Uncharacterized protein n=1 Tax=Nezara viridula TaxID=85310 RepID=A0A9P0HV19_NEZVI|nr:unnamed protein product [Nezara viridula]